MTKKMTDTEIAAKIAAWERTPSQDEMEMAFEKARHSGLFLIKTDRPDEEGCPGSWLGGSANLPPEIEWPCFEYEVEEEVEDEDGECYDEFVIKKIPKHLLAQIDLATLPRIEGQDGIPEQGTLFFFFEPLTASEYSFNRKNVAMNCVIYYPHDVSGFALRSRPLVPYPEMLEADRRDFNQPIEGYDRRPFAYHQYVGHRKLIEPTNAHIENMIIDESLANEKNLREQLSHRHFTKNRRGTSEEIGAAQAYFDANPDNARHFHLHHLFGGRFQIEPEGDLVRLLAIKSDRDLGFEYFGDWIVFWIEREDLQALRFDKAFIQAERS